MPFFDEQDVVGESCATQGFDADFAPAIMLPQFPRYEVGDVRIPQQLSAERAQDDENVGPLTPTAWSALSFMGASGPEAAVDSANLNAHAMQRLHLQTPRKGSGDERRRGAEEEQAIGSDKTSRTAWREAARKDGKRPRSSSSSPCASAIVLARKRALHESWQKRQSAMAPVRQERNRFIYDEESDRARIDDEDDEENSETLQLASFVEYDAADIDTLDINPSQDYLGDASEDGKDPEARQPMDDEIDDVSQSLQQQACSFVEFRDLTQFNEEASEVFDNAIYAPKRETTPTLTLNMPSIREETCVCLDDETPSNIFFLCRAFKQENMHRQMDATTSSYDSESSLSDGFDIPSANEVQSPITTRKCELKESQWYERRSVKRDCSFIDGGCNSSMFEHAASPQSTTKSLGCRNIDTVPRIEELKADYIDSGDDFEYSPTKCSASTYNSSSVTNLSSSSTANRELQPFQPRLLKKRKQARQLGLESFFRSRPCT